MALFKRRTVGKPGEWYYCLEHKKVEEGPECPAKDRFGPYASRQEAEHAMQTARERNLEWENDPKWHDAVMQVARDEAGNGFALRGMHEETTATTDPGALGGEPGMGGGEGEVAGVGGGPGGGPRRGRRGDHPEKPE